MTLKERILEKYKSITYFCFISDVSRSTIKRYIYGKASINVMSAETLSKVCTALDCDPEDIGFTGTYWREYTYPPRTRKYVYELPHKINLFQ